MSVSKYEDSGALHYLWVLHENIFKQIWPDPILRRTHADDTSKFHDAGHVGEDVDAGVEVEEVEDREALSVT